MERTANPTFLGYVREGSVLHEELGWLVHGLEYLVVAIDIVGCLILLLGAARFVIGFLRAEVAREAKARVRGVNAERVELGRYILAGLELLIVSDIVHTALSLAMADLVFLGLLVIIRSLISFFLDRELEQVKKELME
ncbi:DUF1622 domain-containing protein [Jannaschia rubra]|uniref:DUF1622 domain-containing protein n=1 Tax=Jannaschia rubra TaxID=282197 RepID=A0A0M6XTP4_9RHOB|nr:DUF1622 domain-containing protein [Jannaschia rubra]CTQ33555.1 hypothetical protein JAN5088_02337 [Jannaschia rubra]SFG03773.1 Uncharacterized membrane protein [Jannaschia rubra]